VVANRRGRKAKTSDQKLRDALERVQPADYILERRKLFSFVQPPSKDRLEGRNGEIDSEVCDAIGQLCALGYFAGHGHDEIEMRDKGRWWGQHYARLMKPCAMKTGGHEPRSRSTGNSGALTGADLLFDRMDGNLPTFERNVLLSLVVDPLIGTHPCGEFAYWAKALIDEGLRQRGRFVKCGAFPTEHDRGLLNAAIRGLVILVDGALPERWQRRAA
jgi:hypothetical protein